MNFDLGSARNLSFSGARGETGRYAALGLSAPAPGFNAQPGYTVTGDFSQLGNEITIEKDGGGFGTKPGGEKALYVALWEDGHDVRGPDPSLSRVGDMSNIGGTGRHEIQSEVVPEGGVNALQHNFEGSTSSGLIQFIYSSTGKELWFNRRRTNWDFTEITADGMKIWRLWHEGTGNHNVYWDTARVNKKITAEYTGSNMTGVGHDIDTVKNNWVPEKIRIRQGDLDVQNAKTWWTLGGLEEVSPEFWSQRTVEGSGNNHGDRVGYYNFFAGPQEQGSAYDLEGMRSWHSFFYFDNSWCHAVLADSATFADQGVTQEVQPIIGWQDGEVKIHCRPRQGLTHLHVIDQDYNSFYIGEISE